MKFHLCDIYLYIYGAQYLTKSAITKNIFFICHAYGLLNSYTLWHYNCESSVGKVTLNKVVMLLYALLEQNGNEITLLFNKRTREVTLLLKNNKKVLWYLLLYFFFHQS